MRIVKYPECSSVDLLQSIPSGSVIKLINFLIFRAQDGRYVLHDTYKGSSIRMYRCEELDQLFPQAGVTCSLPDNFHVRVEQTHDTDMFSWARATTEIYYHQLKPQPCNCGALYDRSFPDHHSAWCDTNTLE